MSREQMVALDSVLVEVSTNSIKPAVRIRTHHRQLPDGKRLLLVEVPEGDSQHDSPGGSYIRVGGSKQKMTSDERLRLAQRRGQARFRSFDEQTVPDTGFGTLDEWLWKPLLTAEGAAAPESALGKLALLKPDEAGIPRATIAGVLLCTRNPEQWLPNACITATRYRGKERASGQIDAQEITGPLNRQIADAVAFAVRNMHVAARKEPARPAGSASIQRQGAVRGPGQRRGASRLFSARQQNSPVDVRRPPGDSVPRLAAEQPDGGEHDNAAGDSQRSIDLRAGAHAGRGSPRLAGQTVFHGAPRRRCSDHPARNPGTLRETA